MSITIAMRTQVSQLYVSLFGRAPDAEGLGFWAGAMADGMSMARVAQEMYNTAPARDYYPAAATNREIISTFYLNVLGREADASGLEFWTAEMDNKNNTKGDVFAKLLNNVVNYTGTDPAGLVSQALLLNKVAVAQYYGENGGDIANAAKVLVGVTDKYATVLEAKAAIDAGVTIGVQTYNVTAVAETMEGVSVTFNIETTGVAPGTDVPFIVSGTNNAQPSTQLGVVTINAEGKGSVTINTLDNTLLNDSGVMTFKLVKGTEVLDSVNVSILNNDTAQTYAVANVTSVQEGNAVTYNITTTGVPAGTEVSYVVTGTGNASGSAQSGLLSINAEGKASVTINTIENQMAGDDGTLTFVLKNGSTVLATAEPVTVVNDDNAATYFVDVNDTTISEGDVLTYTITTNGVTPGTDLAYIVTGTGNAQASTQVGLATINAQGMATVTVNTYNNAIVGDSGVLSFKLVSNSNTLASAPAVSIANDDQPPPASTVNVTSKEIFGTGAITEGDIVEFTVNTTGYAAGDMLPYTVTGTKNVSGINQAGFVTLGVNGKAVVQVQTTNNEAWGDEGVLTFNLGDGLAVKSEVVANDDVEIIDNTYTLTKESDRIADTNTGNDTFNSTIGGINPTLTSGDKLNGGVGDDTLYVKVNGDDADFEEMNTNTNAFTSIEHVIIDLSDHNLHGASDDAAMYVFDVSDTAIDAEYFDTDNSLQTLTLVANKDSITQEFHDVFVHKDMTIGYVGSGVANNAVPLANGIILGENVENLDIVLDGVGGTNDFLFGGSTLFFTQEGDYSDSIDVLETLTVSGTLAAMGEDIPLGTEIINVDTSLTLLSDFAGEDGYESPAPDVVTISIEQTEDVDSVLVWIEPVEFIFALVGYGDPTLVDSSAPYGMLRNASTLDFSASTVDINTFLMSWQFQASEVDIKFGSGDDVLLMDTFAHISDSDYDTDVATAITIDLGDFNDHNTIILSNELSTEFFGGVSDDDIGGNIKLDGEFSVRDIDLTEDLIIIDNFDHTKDTLSLAFTVLHDSASDDDTYVGQDFTLQNSGSVQAAADAGALAANRADEKFYGAVEAVADWLVDKAAAIDSDDDVLSIDEANEYYAAAFKYGDDTYIYIDTNRNNWDMYGEDGYHALSNGDTLIKLTGISPQDVNLDFTFDAALVGL